MTPPPALPRAKTLLERGLEAGLFQSRWLMAPFYVGLIGAIVVLLAVFFGEIIHELPHILTMKPDDAILLALSLIDLSLASNLVLIVILSGYENFVSKIDTGADEDRPSWMGAVDFSGLKMKLIASIVAISAIALLRAFLKLGEDAPIDQTKIMWMVAVHLTLVASGVLMAVMDWLISNTEKH